MPAWLLFPCLTVAFMLLFALPLEVKVILMAIGIFVGCIFTGISFVTTGTLTTWIAYYWCGVAVFVYLQVGSGEVMR